MRRRRRSATGGASWTHPGAASAAAARGTLTGPMSAPSSASSDTASSATTASEENPLLAPTTGRPSPPSTDHECLMMKVSSPWMTQRRVRSASTDDTSASCTFSPARIPVTRTPTPYASAKAATTSRIRTDCRPPGTNVSPLAPNCSAFSISRTLWSSVITKRVMSGDVSDRSLPADATSCILGTSEPRLATTLPYRTASQRSSGWRRA
mmetsp:Transcript_16285/g.56933  ORF Transcript_16285/g.56933 Transcript_16285/m.56933 type:complete len:209 (-) Transcript_16285:1401-2027(-)